LFEEFLAPRISKLPLKSGPTTILFHGHCHQKSMSLAAPAKTLLSTIPNTKVVDLDAGCCGMAGSFGYSREHYDVSKAIGERKLLPAGRNRKPGSVVVGRGTRGAQQEAGRRGGGRRHLVPPSGQGFHRRQCPAPGGLSPLAAENQLGTTKV